MASCLMCQQWMGRATIGVPSCSITVYFLTLEYLGTGSKFICGLGIGQVVKKIRSDLDIATFYEQVFFTFDGIEKNRETKCVVEMFWPFVTLWCTQKSGSDVQPPVFERSHFRQTSTPTELVFTPGLDSSIALVMADKKRSRNFFKRQSRHSLIAAGRNPQKSNRHLDPRSIHRFP